MRQHLGGFFAMIGGATLLLFLLAGLLLLPFVVGSKMMTSTGWFLGLIFLGGTLLIGLGFIGLGIRLIRSSRNDQIQITPDSFTYAHGQTAITLALSEITRLESRWRQGRRGRIYWALVIMGQFDKAIELEIPEGVYLTTFEVRPILRDLLSRLPAPVEVDLRLQNYVATGQMKW
jgi:hypothetical protein